MPKSRLFLFAIAAVVAAFVAGRWSRFSDPVKADSGDNAQIEVREVTSGTSLLVYYPNLKKLFVYQNPFVGLPTWACSYSVQLGGPGDPVNRQPCPAQR